MARGFQIPDMKADTIVHIFINYYLPIHKCPYFTLSGNGTEFRNQLMDNVLQQCGIDAFLPHIIHKVMKNWKFSTNTLSQLLRNCVKMMQTAGTNTLTKY